MDFGLSPEEEKFRQEVYEFFEREEATEGMKRETDLELGWGPCTWEILKKLGSRGWLTPTWPREYGGLELSQTYRYIVMEVTNYFGGPSALMGAGMAGPVLLRRGSEEQKREYLSRIARGEIEFALGYTESQAGSDLASVEIRAEDKGDHFLMNGQKMFNTACHYAQYHWVIVRTEATRPKHRGLSLFIVDLTLSGITINPIWVMGGTKEMRTNEVFYDEVKVPKECLVGEKNRGFYYVLEALDYERIYAISGMKRRFDRLVEYSKETGKGKDPLIRQKLAELQVEFEVARLFAMRIPWMLDRGITPNYEAAMLKILYAELRERLANVGVQILGHYGILHKESKWAPLDGSIEWEYRGFLRDRITRGTSEIMRNIVATRGLELPR